MNEVLISNQNLSAELKRRFPDVPDNVVIAVMEKMSNNREMCIEVLDRGYQPNLQNDSSALDNSSNSVNTPARMPDGRLIPVPPPRISRDGLRHQGSAGNMSRSSSSSSHNSVSAAESSSTSDSNKSANSNFSSHAEQKTVNMCGQAFYQPQVSPYSSFRRPPGDYAPQNDNRNWLGVSGSPQVSQRQIVMNTSDSDDSPPNTQNSGIPGGNNNNSIQQSPFQNISRLQSPDKPQSYPRPGFPVPTRYVPFQWNPREPFSNNRPLNFPQELLPPGQNFSAGYRYHSRSSEPSVDVSGIHNPLQPNDRFKSSVSFDAGTSSGQFVSPFSHPMNNPRPMLENMRGGPNWGAGPRFPPFGVVTPTDMHRFSPPPTVGSVRNVMYQQQCSGGYVPVEGPQRDISGQWGGGYTPNSRSPSQSSEGSGSEMGYVKAFVQKQNFQLETLLYYYEIRSKQLEAMRLEISDLESRVRQVRREKNETFPTSDDVQKMQDDNRNLLVDVERLTREIDLTDNGQSLLGVVNSENSSGFYAHIQTGQTGSLQSGSVAAPPRTSRSCAGTPPISRPSVPPPPYFRPQRPAPPRPMGPPPRLSGPPVQGVSNVGGGGEFLNSVEEEPHWPCSACTFLNHPALQQCECCDMPKTSTGGESQGPSRL